MNIRKSPFRTLLFAGLASSIFAPAIAAADYYGPVTYRITVQNLTAGQAFTPPVTALHNRRANVFAVGGPANEGVIAIAENGNLEPLITALSGSPDVYSVVQGNAPVVPAANAGGTPFSDSVTFEVTTDRRALPVVGQHADLHERRVYGCQYRPPAVPQADFPGGQLRNAYRAKHRGLCRHRAAVPFFDFIQDRHAEFTADMSAVSVVDSLLASIRFLSS